jgi:hypothetical protein
MSISVWRSHQDAEEAVALAADWMSEHIADRIAREWNGVADALFNANALGDGSDLARRYQCQPVAGMGRATR